MTVQYYTWDCWVSGLPPFPRIHKRTQNFSKWICSCIQVKGTSSVARTVQPFCQTQTIGASPSFHLTATDPVPKAVF